MSNKVVITGIGVVSPIGIGKEEFLLALKNGKSGVQKIERFYPEDLPCKIAGEIKDFSFKNYISPKTARRMDRSTRLGIVAAKQAIEDSKIEINSENEAKIGVIVGTSLGGIQKSFKFHEKVIEKGSERAAPHYMYTPVDACAGYIALESGIKGINFTTATGCSSSVNALGMGLVLIRSGFVDSLVICGTEMPIVKTIMAPFCNSKVLSTRNEHPQKASRPFDKDSDGFVMSEGAGAVILENSEIAAKRHAKIYAELAGYGTTSDSFSMSSIAPTPSGLESSMRLALQDSNTSFQEVDYINAYASSLEHYDLLETKAIKNLFGDFAYNIPVSSTKSMLGHMIGASGIVEVIATVLAIKENFIPPTINLEQTHSVCDLDYVPNKARIKKINVALKNSIANANINSSLVIKRW
ncbi:MAG: beta-ketoacyl-ACP synthase II [Halanaerobiales bacterium]|nr:beta-ketoacyl-ACP synthase II [Halanaerobiales bacterium]